MRYTLEIQKLLNKASQEDLHPKDAVKLLIQAIQIADANNDTELGYELREDLMEKEWGLADRGEFVNAFSWMVNAHDADPESYDAEDLLWKYKWIIDELYANPEVPAEQIESILQDYKRRVTEQGYGLRSYYSKLLAEALDQKEQEKSKASLDQVNALPIDALSDCRACEMDAEVTYLLNKGDFNAGWEKAQPLLAKQFTCAHVPVITVCHLCYHAIKNGEVEKAAELFNKAEEELHEREYDTSLITSIAALIVYLFYTDQEKGWNYMEKYLPWSISCSVKTEYFFAMYMAEALKRADQEQDITIVLPAEHPLYSSSDTLKVKDLYAYYYDLASGHARDFDARNGNNSYTTQVEEAIVE